jgi:hypothetical protein
MAEVKHFLDKDSIQSDADFLRSILDNILGQLKTINNTKIQLQGSKSFGAAAEQVSKLEGLTKELADMNVKLATTEDKLANARLKNAKADTEVIKKKKEQIALDEKIDKQKTKLIAGAEKEAKAIEKANNEYIKLNDQYKVASAASLKRGAELLKEAKGNEALFLSLLKTDKAYLEATKSATGYQKQLLLLEQNVGRSQRNVGNYASAFNGLNNSFGQVARELPSLAINFQTFALAISNNLPIAIDEIQRAQQEIAKLRAEGIKAPSIFKQITGAIFSFQVGISIAIAAFTLLAPKIADFFQEIFKGKKVIEDLSEEQKKYTDILGEEKTQLDVLYRTATDANVPLAARKQAIKELREQYGAYLKNFSDEEILAGKATVAYNNLTEAIIKSARARAAQDILIDNQKKLLALETQLAGVREKTIRESNQAARQRKIVGAAAIEVEVGPSEEELRQVIQKRGRAAAEEIGKQREVIQKENDNLLKTILSNQVAPFTEEVDKDAEKDANKLADLRKKLAEDELAAQRALILLRLQNEADAQQRILESDKFTYEERTSAAQNFYKISRTLLQTELDQELAAIDKKAKEAKLGEEAVQNQKALVKLQFNGKFIQLERKLSDQIFDITKASLDNDKKLRLEALQKRFKAIQDAGSIEISQIQEARDKELLALSERADATALSFEEQQKERLKIIAKYARLELEAQLDKVEELLKLETDPVKRADLEAQAAAIRLKIDDQLTDEKIKNLKEVEAEEKRLADVQKQLQQEIFTLIKTFTLGRFDVAKNQIQEQIDGIEKRKRVELDAINSTSLSAVEKQARISNAEQKAQNQREDLELRQRQLDQQRARFERAFTIASIIQATASAVMTALGKKPYTPENIRLAVLTGAIGAVQLATALATPIPKFRTGKGEYDKYEGPAWVGDGGKSEVIFRENGTMEKTPATPVMTWVGKNDIIHPDADALLNHTLHKQGQVMGYSVPGNYEFAEMTSTLKAEMRNVAKTIQNKREWVVNLNNGKTSIMAKDGTSTKRWINDNMQFGGKK